MSTIIFDFDGTIADSYEYVLGFLRREAGRKKHLDEHEKVELRGYSMASMARKLGMPWWRMPFLFLKGRQEMARHIDQISFFEGMDALLHDLHKTGDKLFIISSNSAVNINYFLEARGLKKYISEVYGGAGILGKAPLLKRALKDHNIVADNCWYIGDEVRDVRAAKRVGMHSVAVTWGYNNAKILHKQKPTAIAFEPGDIRKILEK